MSDYSTFTNYSKVVEPSPLPTNLYGRTVDEKGKPIPGEIVTVEWTDVLGINHTDTTYTLSKKEAKDLGNQKLEGYYMFNKGKIKAMVFHHQFKKTISATVNFVHHNHVITGVE